MTPLLEACVAALLVLGMVFALIGSWGLAKWSDFYKRLHGPSKATTLGVGCVLLASLLWFAGLGQASGHEVLVVLFLFVTAPVSAHLLVQVALRLLPGTFAPPPKAAPRSDSRAPHGAERH